MSKDEDLRHGWRKVVHNFTPSWFTVTMGTGIVAVLLYELPYNGRWLYWLSVTTFCLNIVLFSLASLVSILRYIIWPETWTIMMDHPTQSLFLAAVPMVSGEHLFLGFPGADDKGACYDYSADDIRLCSALGYLGGLYRLGVSLAQLRCD